MKKYLIALVFAVLFFSCQKQEKVIDSIKVWYYNGIFERPVGVGCDEIIYKSEKVDTLDVLTEDGLYLSKQAVILETVITDKKVLQEIKEELKLARKTKDFGMDARTKCFIQYTNGSIDTLCLEEDLTYGYYNNKVKRFTNKFAYLIRKNSGFYWWIGVDYMKYFDELNDTSFVREKIQSRYGGEY